MPKFHVSRSIDIGASAEEVFAVVSDFGTWTTWSPWLLAEPDARVTLSDDTRSVGSSYEWDGRVTGAGRLTHTHLDRPHRVESEIRFFRPMKSVSTVAFELAPSGAATRVTWSMDGSLPWFMFWMVRMMDDWIGMDYARGLRMLKEWIETGRINSRLVIHGPEAIEARRLVGVRRSCAIADIGREMSAAIDELRGRAPAGEASGGTLMAAYHEFDISRQRTAFTVGHVVDASSPVPEGLTEWAAPASRAFRVEHIGAYEHLGNAWAAAQQHLRYGKLKASKVAPCEVYRNAPDETEPADLRTDVYIPLRS